MQNKSVFLALDDGITASNIRKILIDAGIINLKVFSTYENMLKEVINISPPDLIIADTDLRDRNNLVHSIEQIRTRFRIPVIFLFRERKLSDPDLTKDPGCDYISKSLADNKLLRSLEKFLNTSSASADTPSDFRNQNSGTI